MSKQTFSQKISESIYKKINSIENMDINAFLKKDEYFEIALCLSYMTLSKEKIIKKDIKNKDRIARLSQMVDSSEINKVFQTGFAKEMPVITYAKENNNLWILDNIRDSIMHGAFDVDEEKQLFLINNNQYDRELIAEIPFSWFISYAKNDILSKKILDNYTIRNFYYNKYKKNKNNFYTNKELINNILYNVNIKGNKFNINIVEKRIKELFDIYSNQYLIDAYNDKNFAFVSDYVRLYAIYNEGGFYLDTDVELKKDFSPFLDKTFFTCFENAVMLNLAVFGAEKGCEILKIMLDYYDTLSYFKKRRKKPNLLPITVPISLLLKDFSCALNGKTQSNNDILLLSKDFYFPTDCVSYKTKLTSNTRGIHQYAFSWATKGQLSRDNFVRFIRIILTEPIFRFFMGIYLKIRLWLYSFGIGKKLKKIRKLNKKEL